DARALDGRICGRCERETEGRARLGRIEDAVVPQARARVVRAALALELLANRGLERVRLLGLLLGVAAARLLTDRPQGARCLLAAHHRDARVRPHEEEARLVGA